MADMIFVKDDALMPSDWTYRCTHCHESISHRNLGLRFCPCCGTEIKKWQSEDEGVWSDEFFEMWDEDDEWKPKWISVEERLPDKCGHYLVFIKDSMWPVCEASFFKASKPFWLDPVEEYERYEGVTHWMELPKPPKEKE